MSDPLSSIKYKGMDIYTFHDCDPISPRDWDNLGTMICFHNRYILGDKNNYNHKDYCGWYEMKSDIIKNENPAVILPLYLYDHSGISINTTGFNCRWDSGQVGFTYVSKDKLKKEYSINRISKKILRKAEEILISEVEVYNEYLNGNIYGYTVEKDGDQVDSCWNIIGYDECIEEAKNIVDIMCSKNPLYML
jgi:hypothetical protein